MRNKYAEHAYKFPPHCISHFKPVPVVDLPSGIDFTPAKADFRIGCSCGEKAVYLLGYKEAYPDGDIFLDPLAIECPTCHLVVELFDRRKHGYDGEQDLISGYKDDEIWPPNGIEYVRYATPCCGQTVLELVPGFGYQIEDFEDEELQRPQDFFDWFSLSGRCISCGSWQKITDVECA